MSDETTPSAKAIAFAKAWLGIENEPQDWDVGIWGGDYIHVGESCFALIDDMGDGPPRGDSERNNIETEVTHAFAKLLDLYAAQQVKEAVETEKREAQLNLERRMKDQLLLAIARDRARIVLALEEWRKSALFGRDTAMRVGKPEIASAFNFVVGVYTRAIKIVWGEA